MKAVIFTPDNKRIVTRAEKSNGSWLIGGDFQGAWRGSKIFIVSKGQIYLLKGSRLIFQDSDDPSNPFAWEE